jgi:hypothetical protein
MLLYGYSPDEIIGRCLSHQKSPTGKKPAIAGMMNIIQKNGSVLYG